MRHLAPRRADYERVFTGVNLKTDIISGTLFNSSGTLFWAPETIDSSGTLFRQFDPNLLATLYLTPTGDPSNPVHYFQSNVEKYLEQSEISDASRRKSTRKSK